MQQRSCTRRLEWDAGHRVLNHQGKCRHLHGHRYVAEITAVADDLDDLSMVVDFSCLKAVIGSWIDEHWDHNMMLHAADPLLRVIDRFTNTHLEQSNLTMLIFGTEKEPYVMPEGMNPTAEAIAEELFRRSNELLGDARVPVRVTHVRVHETPNCYADYWEGDE